MSSETKSRAGADDLTIILSREDAGIVLDGLILEIARGKERKAVNSESTSDIRVESCERLIRYLNAEALESSASADTGTTGAEGHECVEVLREIEEQLRREYDPRLPFVSHFHGWVRAKLQAVEAATTQRAPVTPPKMMTCGICGKPFPDENGKGFCVCVLD